MPTSQSLAEQIRALEDRAMSIGEELRRLRAQQPHETVGPWTFRDEGDRVVSLAELFGNHARLVLVHNMGFACPYCTLWADHFNATADFLAQHETAFVLSNPEAPSTNATGKAKRGWRFPVVSTRSAEVGDSGFAKAMGYADEQGNPWPGVSTFVREADGRVVRWSHTAFGPGDAFCPAFHFLNLLPSVRGVHGDG